MGGGGGKEQVGLGGGEAQSREGIDAGGEKRGWGMEKSAPGKESSLETGSFCA